MQEEQPPVCSRCGHKDPGSYCPDFGLQQDRRRSSSGSVPFHWKPAHAVVAAVFVLILTALAIGTLLYANAVFVTGSPLGIPRPTATPVQPVHALVTCQEIANHWILETDGIRQITQLSTTFKGQDRMECSGWVDVEWTENEWITLGAERGYRDDIIPFLDWD